MDDLIVDARATMHDLLRPLTSSEIAAEVALLRRRPTYYDEAAPLGERIYDPIRDVTLETDGFPAWQELSTNQQRAVLLRLGQNPRSFRKLVMRAGLIAARDLRERAGELLRQQKRS
jgi:hypothetical protein